MVDRKKTGVPSRSICNMDDSHDNWHDSDCVIFRCGLRRGGQGDRPLFGRAVVLRER